MILFRPKVQAQLSCTQLNSPTSAQLRGQITDNGGDPNITVWFNWRPQGSFSWNQTPSQNVNVISLPFNFYFNLSNLQACTTYEYKAVARNSVGTSEGSVQCFRTACQPLSISCNASPNPARINQTVTFFSTVNGGVAPYTYSWAGACIGSSANCQTSFNSLGTFTAHLTVRDSIGSVQSTQCSVTVQGSVPTVITLPPVETL